MTNNQVNLDTLIPGLTSDLPEDQAKSRHRMFPQNLRTQNDLETVFSQAADTLIALKPTDVPYFWVLGVEDKVYVLDTEAIDSFQDAATRHNISFVVPDVFGSKKALLDLGLTQTVDCIGLQHRILNRNAASKRIPANQMVSVFQENELELARLSNLGWYGLLRDTQDLAASPGFDVSLAAYNKVLEDWQTSGAKKGKMTYWTNVRDTCVDKFPIKIKPLGTVSGRFTTAQPSAQGLPRDLRKALYAPQGKVLVSADYHQAQPRILYGLSHDENFGRPFLEGTDIYKQIAGAVLGKQPSEVTDIERKLGKELCIGFAYFMKAPGIEDTLREVGFECENLHAMAAQIEAKLAEEFSAFYRWRMRILAKGSQYLEEPDDGRLGLKTPSGRVIWYRLPTDFGVANWPHLETYKTIEVLCSHLAQAIEIEIVADAIKRFSDGLKSENLTGAGLMLCLHDAIIAYCDKGEAEKVADLLKKSMEDAFESYPEMVKTVNLVEVTGPSECWGDLK